MGKPNEKVYVKSSEGIRFIFGSCIKTASSFNLLAEKFYIFFTFPLDGKRFKLFSSLSC